MGPGQKTKTQFWADDRVFWWSLWRPMKVSIDGQEPFIAGKGLSGAGALPRAPTAWRRWGSEPVIRFEVRAAGAIPNYPASETPAPVKGWKFVDAVYSGRGKYDEANKPYLDFQKEIVEGGGKGGGFVARRPYLGQCDPGARRAHAPARQFRPLP